MIALTRLRTELRKRVKKLSIGEVLEITTYKRDRGFIIYCLFEGGFRFREFGYENLEIDNLTEDRLLANCDKAIKREFPRSNQARIYLHHDEATLISGRR